MSRINIKQFPSNKHFFLTKEGLDELKAKLDALREERYRLCNQLRMMDPDEKVDHILSTDAIKKLEMNEKEVAKLADILLNAKTFSKNEKTSDVRVGSTVNLRFGDQTVAYTLVDPIEADPSANKISEDSPLGRALLGKKAHQKIRFVAPRGKVYSYKLEFIN